MLVKYVPAQVDIDPELLAFAKEHLVGDYSFDGIRDCLSTFINDRLRQELADYEERRARRDGRSPMPADQADEAECPF